VYLLARVCVCVFLFFFFSFPLVYLSRHKKDELRLSISVPIPTTTVFASPPVPDLRERELGHYWWIIGRTGRYKISRQRYALCPVCVCV
jgi:hypothetical protein